MTLALPDLNGFICNLSRITMTSQWARLRLKSPASRLFDQSFLSVQNKEKNQTSASLAFLRGIHRWPVDSPHKGPVTQKFFHLMTSSWEMQLSCYTQPTAVIVHIIGDNKIIVIVIVIVSVIAIVKWVPALCRLRFSDPQRLCRTTVWMRHTMIMKTSSNGNIFRVFWPFVRVTGGFPSHKPVTRSLDVFFDARLNKRLSKQPRGW